MNTEAKELLQRIGQQLDGHVFPEVTNGGFVLPGKATVFLNPPGKEYQNGSKREARSATQSWPGAEGQSRAAGGSWAAAGPWSPGGAAPVLFADEGGEIQLKLTEVTQAYPGARIWQQEDGFWLFTESALLPGLGRTAGFLTGVSTAKRAVRSWGFWYSKAVGASWIGPRHTNFPDGSICAYDPNDGTWVFGDSLVSLLDLYSVWALRQLHFEKYGHWPGPQSVPLLYERILEVMDNEHCGCGRLNTRYGECCKPRDLKADLVVEAIRFGFCSGWSLRHPPAAVFHFLQQWNKVPSLVELV